MAYDPGSPGAATELRALEEGYGPLYQQLMQELGSLSIATASIEDAQEGLEKARANELVLREVAELLPHAAGEWHANKAKGGHDLGIFEFGGRNQQYLARQVQANTVWLRLPAKEDLDKVYVRSLMPCYVIGRRFDVQDDSTGLLLLPASGITKWVSKETRNAPPRIVSARKEDVMAWDALSVLLLRKDYNDEHGEELLDQVSGRLTIRSTSPGSAVLEKRGLGQASEGRVLEKGIRYDSGSTQVLERGIDDETLEAFSVDSHVARLAIAFDITEAYKTILAHGRPNEAMLITTEQRLRDQNRRLRQRLGSVASAVGLWKPDEVTDRINEEFPPI